MRKTDSRLRRRELWKRNSTFVSSLGVFVAGTILSRSALEQSRQRLRLSRCCKPLFFSHLAEVGHTGDPSGLAKRKSAATRADRDTKGRKRLKINEISRTLPLSSVVGTRV